jgi:hypothetical protein
MALIDLQKALLFVMTNMTEESQFEDFQDQFEQMDDLIRCVTDSQVVAAYDKLSRELYVAKGALDCVEAELRALNDVITSALSA